MFRKVCFFLLFMILVFPQYLLAESSNIEIIDVVLAQDVAGHMPEGVLEPPAFCGTSQDQDRTIPVVPPTVENKVCLWTKVKSSATETLSHSWYRAGMGWEKMAEISLTVKKSPGFRTWSCKKIIPKVHSGRWMVVIRRAADPETALCRVDFEIKE